MGIILIVDCTMYLWHTWNNQIRNQGNRVNRMTVPRERIELGPQKGPKGNSNWEADVEWKCIQGPGQLVEPFDLAMIVMGMSRSRNCREQDGIWLAMKINLRWSWCRGGRIFNELWKLFHGKNCSWFQFWTNEDLNNVQSKVVKLQ